MKNGFLAYENIGTLVYVRCKNTVFNHKLSEVKLCLEKTSHRLTRAADTAHENIVAKNIKKRDGIDTIHLSQASIIK